MNQQVPMVFPGNVTLTIKREDLLHPHISGNKFRKLKYNIAEAKAQGHTKLLTFGGAYSNHIAATAAAGKAYGIDTIGIIRGEELVNKIGDNPTLTFAKHCGMALKFVTRDTYRHKTDECYIRTLQEAFGTFYLLPEGGTNTLAVKGCEEILTADDAAFTHICCAVGTGGTIAGLANSAYGGQAVLGFPAVKSEGLGEEIGKLARGKKPELVYGYEFGGYGKVNEALIAFINDFFEKTAIPLDPVYTGKMVFGVTDMIYKGYFPENASILLIHTGGLQGIAGMNTVLKKKKLPLIKT